ncbi:hypothetical protein [Deinococcus sp.]|uniref:hypothetical protein n=1 Tax=Deinococcus sp. TaxID=47478 RepID=UPI0025CD04DB|nr:hypothetical protein [Deinococcus sp.]
MRADSSQAGHIGPPPGAAPACRHSVQAHENAGSVGAGPLDLLALSTSQGLT